MTTEEFDREFSETPMARPGRAGLLRNAAIVLGNSGDSVVIPTLIAALRDHEPLIRGAAVWALRKLDGEEARIALKQLLEHETDPMVREEYK